MSFLDQPSYTPVQSPLKGATGSDGTSDVSVLEELLRILARRRVWIIACVALGLIVAIAITLTTVPVYESTATIELNGNNAGSFSLGIGDALGSQNSIGDGLRTDLQTQTAILQDDTLALAVIERLNLQTQPPFAAPQKLSHGASKPDPEQALPLEDAPKRRAHLLGIFRKHLTVKPMRDTSLIQVSFQSQDPKQAAEVANALIESYKDQYLKTHYEATAEASEWLTHQLSDLKANVEDSEKKLADFERETGIIGLGMQNADQGSGAPGMGLGYSSLVIQKLQQLNMQLTAAEANRIEKEAIYRLAKTGDADLISSLSGNLAPDVANSAVITQGGGLSNLERLRAQRNEIEQNLATAGSIYGANNRHLKEMELQLGTVNDQIRKEVHVIAERAGADFQLAKQTEDGIHKELETQQGLASKLNEKTVQFALLNQEATSRKKLYEDLYTRLQEANVSAGVKATNITIVDPARASSSPIKPNMRFNVASGIMIGLFTGFGLAFLVDGLDPRLANPEEIQALTGLPEVGAVPEFRDASSKGPLSSEKVSGKGSPRGPDKHQLWVLTHPTSSGSEAIRALRTSIMLSQPGRAPKLLLVTSCIPAEGKTTITANLAVAFAQHNMKTIIVEGDMRRARVAHIFGVENGKGLSGILSGQVQLEDAIQSVVGLENLHVLPSGPRPPLPSELLGSAAFEALLQQLRDTYDIVLIDSPPALVVADAILMSSHADAVLWVAGAGTVTRPMIRRAAQMIRRNRMPIVGFVVNRMTKRMASYQYGYSYYGSYYGDESGDEI